MAYLPNYAHDVFISYAHDDDIPRWEMEDGWVTNFRDALVRQLPGHLARDGGLDRMNLDVWKDTKKIKGADYYDDKIERAVLGSAVMISVMSRSYFESTYCLQELKTFYEHSDIMVEFEDGKKSRVIKLILSDISKHKLDERISRTDGFKFYAEDKEGNEQKFMRTAEGTPDDGYWRTMEKLAGEVGKVMTRMAKLQPTAPAPPTGLSIYLAEVTDDLEDVRAEIKEALTQQGIQVLPELRLPSQSRAMKKEIARNLEQAVLSVHLMGPLPGKAADGDALPATQIQYRLASGMGVQNTTRSKLQRVVWLPPELDIPQVKSDAQRTFLESLRYEQEKESPMELIQRNVEDLKAEIIKKVLPPKKMMISKFEPNRTAYVYIAHHPEDVDDAEIIKSHLRDAKQDVALMRGKDRKEQMKDLRARMLGCQAVLILYGRSPLMWAREVTEKARDFANRREGKLPLWAKSICDGPPDPKDDLGFDFEGWETLKCRKGIGIDALEPFIKAVAVKS